MSYPEECPAETTANGYHYHTMRGAGVKYVGPHHIPGRVPTAGDAPRVASSTVTASAANPRRIPGVGVPPVDSGDRIIEGVLLLNLMEERLRELWRQHRWYQAHLGWIIESEMENRAELRFVLRMLRKARRDAMRVPDGIDMWKGTWR